MGAVDFGFWGSAAICEESREIMNTVAIFVLGLFVSGITVTAAILVGFFEAADPNHSRVEDLTDIERNVVGRGEKVA